MQNEHKLQLNWTRKIIIIESRRASYNLILIYDYLKIVIIMENATHGTLGVRFRIFAGGRLNEICRSRKTGFKPVRKVSSTQHGMPYTVRVRGLYVLHYTLLSGPSKIKRGENCFVPL